MRGFKPDRLLHWSHTLHPTESPSHSLTRIGNPPGEFDDGGIERDKNYVGYEYFIASFLQDWTVRTENPFEANLFFIPALVSNWSAHELVMLPIIIDILPTWILQFTFQFNFKQR